MEDLIAEILNRDDFGVNDFISLVLSGEMLRQEHPDSEVLIRYDRFIGEYGGERPTDLDRDLEDAIRELAMFASMPLEDRDPECGENIVAGIEDILTIAGVCGVDLVGKAVRAVSGLVHKLQDIWERADYRSGVVWGELARFAPGRIELRIAILESIRKRKIIEGLVASYQ